MRINDPDLSFFENSKKILVLCEIQANDNILKGLVDFDSSDYFPLVIEKNNILDRGIIVSEG